MRSKYGALHQWLGGFGMKAYVNTAVPEDAELPYITYSAVLPVWGGGEGAVSLDVWRRTTSEARANADADAISQALGLSGVMLMCAGGSLWIRRGAPFAQPAASGEDGVTRRHINLVVESTTTY